MCTAELELYQCEISNKEKKSNFDRLEAELLFEYNLLDFEGRAFLLKEARRIACNTLSPAIF